MKIIKFFLLSLLIATVTSCGSANKATSTIVGGDYDAKKNTTEYFVLPYGQVSIPGKWDKTTYISSSRQQNFTNKESINLAISFGPCNKYEFNRDGALKGYEFVKAFYKWDSDYFVSNGLQCEILESNSTKHYIIYRAFGRGFDTYFLIGEKNGCLNNFSINITDKWTAQQKIDFLKNLF